MIKLNEIDVYLGDKMKIHHLGIIVKDIEVNLSIYEKLGYIRASDTTIDQIQNNTIVFLRSPDLTQMIELIEPIDETSSIYHSKEGYHHICYEVNNREQFINDFKKLKIGKIFTKPQMAPAIENREIVFACLKNGTFVEFLF